MITAEEAKALYDASGREIDVFIKNVVEDAVVVAAKAGQRNTSIHLGSIRQSADLGAKITQTHKGVLDKLSSLGYRCSIAKSGLPYVPAGLRDDEGNGPMYTNYALSVSW